MDPNATLRALRESWAQVRDAVDDDDTLMALAEAAEAADSLDQWLSTGGALPAAWQRGRDEEGRTFARRPDIARGAPLPYPTL